MDQYAAFIPVRGGSKSIPLKNIRLLCGRPLMYWTMDAAVKCPEIERVYICTDSEDIRKKAEEYAKEYHCGSKLQCIGRPSETATDHASTESAMVYFGNNWKDFQHIVLIQATSPLLTAAHLSAAISSYEKGNFDSMLSVVRQNRFCWQKCGEGYVPTNYDYKHRPRRQEFDGYLVENGAFYINTREALLRDQCRLSGRIGVFEMEAETYFEVDEPHDWLAIEQILQTRTEKFRELADRASGIKMLLTDCDGVLTDGGMYYSESGDELKQFNTRDGMAVRMLHDCGILFGILTGENVELVRRRAEKVQADECRLGVDDKRAALADICKKYGLGAREIAYIGDDVNDEEIMRLAGLPCSVSDGAACIRDAALYVTNAKGGQGAVREVAEMIIRYRVNR